jgi:crotonobetainyl-CoA:carnitine CoA-transferase CaiB-like acyl-CoA transferase
MDLPAKIAARRGAMADFMMSLKTWPQVEAAFATMNVAWGEIRPGGTLRDHPTLKHRKTLIDIDDRAGGRRTVVQSPYRMSGAKTGVRGPAPHRGEHNGEELGEWLGFNAAQVADLEKGGVIEQDDLARALPR